MLSEFNFDLSRRLLRCRSWSWMPGMLALELGEHEIDTAYTKRLDDGTEDGMKVSERAIPVLSDHATLGCIVGLIQRVSGNNTVSLQCLAKASGAIEWNVTGVSDGRRFFIGEGATMEYALVTALETTGSNGKR